VAELGTRSAVEIAQGIMDSVKGCTGGGEESRHDEVVSL